MSGKHNFLFLDPAWELSAEDRSNLPKTLPTTAKDCPSLEASLWQFAAMIANVTESFTAAIFLVDNSRKTLRLAAAQSLSTNLRYDTEVSIGRGVLGWVAQEGKRLVISPFARDPKSLRYYSTESNIKSFIAVPILSESGTTLGVIACDSKKSYAFAQITEKLLDECARHAAHLLALYSCLAAKHNAGVQMQTEVNDAISAIRESDSERRLIKVLEQILGRIGGCEAAALLLSPLGSNVPDIVFNEAKNVELQQQLLDIVSKHKKFFCAEKSLHLLPSVASGQRAFLSVPIDVMGSELGSINLLASQDYSFTRKEIEAIERIAAAAGTQIELCRLRECSGLVTHDDSKLSPALFMSRARRLIAETHELKKHYILFRCELGNATEVEQAFGADALCAAFERAKRLLYQVCGSTTICCGNYGWQMLVGTSLERSSSVYQRFTTLLSKLDGFEDQENFLYPGLGIGQMMCAGLNFASATTPRDGRTIEDLLDKTLADLVTARSRQQREVAVHA